MRNRTVHTWVRRTAWLVALLPPFIGAQSISAQIAAPPGSPSARPAQQQPVPGTTAEKMAAQAKARLPKPGQIIFNDRSPRPSNRNLSGATYVGIDVCSGCHGRLTSTRPRHTIIEEWESNTTTNPHAKDSARLGTGTTNIHTRSPISDGYPAVDKNGIVVAKRCDTCHSTGAPGFDPATQTMFAGMAAGGFDNSQEWFPLVVPAPNAPTPANWDVHKHNMKFTRVQCENCHGPGSKHVRSGGSPLFINRVPDARRTCFDCHAHAPNEKGNILASPATDEQIALYSSSLSRAHSGATLITGTGGYEYAGEDYSAGRNHPHTKIRASCVTCHTPKDPRSPILDHSSILPKIGACRNCHGAAREVEDVEDWEYVRDRQAVINNLLIQLGGATASGAPDRAGNGGLLGNAADKNSVEFKRARWNHSFVVNDASAGAHNFDYAIELLTTSIGNAPAQKPPTPARR